MLCEDRVYSLLGAGVVGSGNQARGLAANRQKHLNPHLLPYSSDIQWQGLAWVA